MTNEAYEIRRDKNHQYELERSQKGRDIGDIPPVSDPELKEKCRNDFRLFCETYFSHIFYLEWSKDHLEAIQKIQRAILEGGLYAFAQPRGSGKSVLCRTAAIWATLYGHRRFVVIIGADESHATESLDAIKIEIETNDRLDADFPEICFPVRKLEGIANRCAGQLHRGERTQIVWTQREIRFPTVAGSPASGSTIRTAGITGRVRGMGATTPDGQSIRPDFAVIDDPQTDESARSVSQCFHREKIVCGAILGLAGPGKKLSGFLPCTVIRRGDLADTLLDTGKHPEWQGKRYKLLYSEPEAADHWKTYATLRTESLNERGDISKATEYYRQNRDAMDKGAVVAWEQRYNPDELSAIQHAVNLRLTDETSYQAEYQNEPKQDTQTTTITEKQILENINGYKRNETPEDAQLITAFIDVQKNALYYVVAGWASDYTGYVLDYGVYPEQPSYHKYSEIQTTLEKVHKTTAEEAIGAGLATLTKALYERDYNGLKIDRIIIDSGYQTQTIHTTIRRSQTPLVASRGIGIGAKNKPLSEYNKKKGDRFGHHWYITRLQGKRLLNIDINYWKSFLVERLAMPITARGSISLFGKDERLHRLFAEHITSEYPVQTSGYGRTVDEWKLKPNRDNHWLDCLVGCAAGASVAGLQMSKGEINAKNKTKSTNTEQKKNKRAVSVSF